MKLQKLLGEDDFDRSPIIKPPPTTPTYLKSDLPDADLVMHPDGTVKAGTLPALVEHLTMHNAMDAAFNSTFLMTFRSFTTPQAVYDLLCKRYEIQPPEGLDETELEDWREKKMKPVKFRWVILREPIEPSPDSIALYSECTTSSKAESTSNISAAKTLTCSVRSRSLPIR